MNEDWGITPESMRKLVHSVSGRDDVRVSIEPEDDIAFFSYEEKKVVITPDAFIGTMSADFTEEMVRLENPLASGLLYHEIGHVKHSLHKPSYLREEPLSLSLTEIDTYMLLEEGRIEMRISSGNSHIKTLLRHSASHLLQTEKGVSSHAPGTELARILLLGYGRISAGILENADLEKLNQRIIEFFGLEVIQNLQTLWEEFQAQPDEELTVKKRIAKEVTEILERFDANSSPLDELLEVIAEVLAELEIKTALEINDAIRDKEILKKAQSKATVDRQIEQHKNEADRVFESVETSKEMISHLAGVRPPTVDERRAAIRVRKVLERARHRDRSIVTSNNALPPGRLKVGQIMQSKAGAKGIEPWKRKRHTQIESPILSVGIMSDISGSMGGTMGPMASLNWIMKNAVQKLDGRVEAVYFGNNVFPGQADTQVHVYQALDGSEEFDLAFQALDGKLDLLYGRGVRMLVVCSDGNYRPQQRVATEKWLTACVKHGVTVLWLGLSHGHAVNMTAKTGTRYVPIGEDLERSIELIVEACKKELLGAG